MKFLDDLIFFLTLPGCCYCYVFLIGLITYKIYDHKVIRILKIKTSEKLKTEILRHFEQTNLFTVEDNDFEPLKGEYDSELGVFSVESENEQKLLIVPSFPETHLDEEVAEFAHFFEETFSVDILIADGTLEPSKNQIIEHQFEDTANLEAYLELNERTIVVAFDLSCRKVLEVMYRNPQLVSGVVLINCPFDSFTLNADYLGKLDNRLGERLLKFYNENKEVLNQEGEASKVLEFEQAPKFSTYDEAFYSAIHEFDNLEEFYEAQFANPEIKDIKCKCLFIEASHYPIPGNLETKEIFKNGCVEYLKLNGNSNSCYNEYGDDIVQLIISDWIEEEK